MSSKNYEANKYGYDLELLINWQFFACLMTYEKYV